VSTEETNGFSAPNEDANVAGADSTESAPAGQAAENNETAPGADDAAQASSEDATDDMSAFEEQIEDSDLANALERIAAVEDQLARANAELYNQGQEYANYVRRSLISVLDDIAAARAHGDLEDGPFASIATKLEETLKTRFELERYGAEGDDFDPTLHDALMATTSADVDHPVIGQVLASGYRRADRVVRAAKVLVNNPE